MEKSLIEMTEEELLKAKEAYSIILQLAPREFPPETKMAILQFLQRIEQEINERQNKNR